jgi:cytochrome c biogenesis protein CcmG/thiol:disulfide interchange protein DsbE
MLRRLLILAVLVAACGGGALTENTDIPDLPATTGPEFAAHMATIDRPAVVNVWASWCIPCRSEAPLLDRAFRTYGADIEFIGVAVADNQPDAKAFLSEFGLGFDHFFDRDRSMPSLFGGIGTPITFFFGPGGELISTHNGVMDDRTLALNIDELLRLEP